MTTGKGTEASHEKSLKTLWALSPELPFGNGQYRLKRRNSCPGLNSVEKSLRAFLLGLKCTHYLAKKYNYVKFKNKIKFKKINEKIKTSFKN